MKTEGEGESHGGSTDVGMLFTRIAALINLVLATNQAWRPPEFDQLPPLPPTPPPTGDSIAGVWVTPRAAGQLLWLHDQLTPADQELFAAGCNRDFRPWLANLLTCIASGPVAKVLAGLLTAAPGQGAPALQGQTGE